MSGNGPGVQPLPVGQLYIDHSYQQTIRIEGRKQYSADRHNIRLEASQPFLVALIKGQEDAYTVIDGQVILLIVPLIRVACGIRYQTRSGLKF